MGIVVYTCDRIKCKPKIVAELLFGNKQGYMALTQTKFEVELANKCVKGFQIIISISGIIHLYLLHFLYDRAIPYLLQV